MIGDIIAFYGDKQKIPFGYLLCDGSAIDKNIYTELFNHIGYKYGRNGDNFKVPDFRNVCISSTTDKNIAGIEFLAQLKSHTHGVGKHQIAPSGAHTHSYYAQVKTNYFSGGSSGKHEKYYKSSPFLKRKTAKVHKYDKGQGGHSNHSVIVHQDGVADGQIKAMCVLFLIEY